VRKVENSRKKVMLVEDNQDLLLNFHLILEDHKFEVISAKDGNEALMILSNEGYLPDIIISDILMPEMDGYEFLKKISSIPKYSHIPFIFLTALSLPKDIKYARELGADEFLVKPIEEEDLISIIRKKLKEKQLSAQIYDQFEKRITIAIPKQEYGKEDGLIKDTYLIHAIWDDKLGPVIQKTYPSKRRIPLPIDKITVQLFHAANLIYGHDSISESESLLLNLKNIEKSCFLFLDSYSASNERQGRKVYMLAVIARSINYLNSLKIKEVFREFGQEIKSKSSLNKNHLSFKKYWTKIIEILY
jgi:CheY-like chemotaxis protein